MRSALIIGVSVLALGLGGCSWVERTTGIGGGSDQSTAQAEPAQPATSSAMSSGASQAPTPQPQQAQAPTTAGSGSTMHHPMHASNEVRMAQQKLKDDGDYMGKIDGLAGPQTRQALMQYQKKNGLKQTGHLDHATLSKLGVGSGSAATSGSSMAPAAASGSTSGSSDNGSSGGSMSGSSASSPAPATGNTTTNPAPTGTTPGGSGH